MAKRLFDLIFSILTLLILFPLMLLVALIIKMTSKGPVFYKATRAGLYGKEVIIHKFRTMRIGADCHGQITAANDNRVYPFGKFLRASKIDELPQFFDVLMGTMSIVGPRPESIEIVKKHYSDSEMDTLSVKPGIASPGSIFNYTHGDQYLNETGDTDLAYVEKLLPIKLAIEKEYIKKTSIKYDIQIIFRTISTIIQMLMGKKQFEYPPEYVSAIHNLKDDHVGNLNV